MAIARNLKSGGFAPRPQKFGKFFSKHKKKVVVVLVVLSVLAGIYGIFNLSHLAPEEAEKQPVTYETGDQPLPEKVTIVINASGGLNLREEPNTTSKIIKIIPDKTKLEAEEIVGEWYKVSYDGKTGWVNEKYIKRYTGDSTGVPKDGLTYQSTAFDFSLQYPGDWVKMDYGANQASGLVGYIGFGMQLADEVDPNVLPPVAIKITKDTKAVVDADYKKRTSVVVSKATIDGSTATKYIFTASSGVQMTAYVVSGNGFTYIFEESGGYADELKQMVGTAKIGL